MIVQDFLKNIEMFKALDDSQLAAIKDSFHEKEFVEGDKIFSEGDPASHIWVVVEGKVDLRFDLPGRTTSEETTISTITDTHVFGWSSLVPPHRYRLSAYCAAKRTRVLRCSREVLDKLFENNTQAGYRFMSDLIKLVGKRFQQLQSITSPIPFSKIKATVHMGTCGITAGAREVMTTLLDEKSKTDRNDILIQSAGCIGKCTEEPNVTIEMDGREPVIYRKVDAEKAKQIFTSHLVEGNILEEHVLSK